ncbi:MAG: transglutaminase-like domain-containing protein [Chitinophagales bacterium]
MANDNEIQALIQLLDDEDKEVFRHVHDKLLSLGTEVIPSLEQAWSSELNPATHERLEEIIREIQFTSLENEWIEWVETDSPELLTGAYLVARYFYPELKFEEVEKRILKLKQTIWLELNYNQTPLEQIQIFNQVFYNYHDFQGTQNTAEYQDLCINHVLETKKGSSIAVGIIYQIVANELNLPIYGVTLSQHYILAFCKKTLLDFTSENLEKEVMFYINPVNRGSIFSRNEVKDYLDKLKAEHHVRNFQPASNKEIIREMLTYLLETTNLSDPERQYAEINKLLGYLA